MKTITDKNTSVSVYAFEDGASVAMLDDRINVSMSNGNLIIADMNSSNALLHTNITLPDDWEQNKYLFDGTTWLLK